jgi:hypothetical protein
LCPPPGGVDHDDLARRVGAVLKGVWDLRGQVGETPFIAVLDLIADAGRQAADTFRPLVHAHENAWFSVMGEAEQEQFLVALHRLQERLRESR